LLTIRAGDVRSEPGVDLPFTGLVAAYWRTNLTMCQIGQLFRVSDAAAHRVIDTLDPLLALAPVLRRPGRLGVLSMDVGDTYGIL